ncbi:MAG: DeoR/GlpR family DNA-binding transcription regulator [Clostridia bacterium]|nr:DeoR/GlpR family DNA-binding transcription regulator [Clostridia bacterium]
MLSDARQKFIKDFAFENGEVIISDAAKRLGVSLETVRRDINVLESLGILEKVHGGAVPVRVNSQEHKYSERKSTNERVKQKLGAFVGAAIKDSTTIFLSAGTTVETITNFGDRKEPVTVITNSLSIAETLGKVASETRKIGVLLLGGKFNADEHYTYGSAVVADIRKYHADVVVISAVGIDEFGAMCASQDEGIIISEMINSSAKVILAADSSKFGKKAAYRHCSIDQIDHIVTDNANTIPERIYKVIKKKNIKIDII